MSITGGRLAPGAFCAWATSAADRAINRYAFIVPIISSFAPHSIAPAGSIRWSRRDGGKPGTACAGINRHVVGDERALQERRSDSILTSSLAPTAVRPRRSVD